jgi:Smg protein
LLDLDGLKIIILMVYWSLGIEPDPQLLDELCEDSGTPAAH